VHPVRLTHGTQPTFLADILESDPEGADILTCCGIFGVDGGGSAFGGGVGCCDSC